MDPQELEEQPVPGPKPIQQLSEDVVNRIAAAEIIHRPSNAIKELLENSLDAGSTSIKVTTKDGGLKSMIIADNGHGIRKADLPLLCKRFATSKLRAFSDLKSLHTYGFRGEALASISFVSRVTVVTKIESDAIGWKAHYNRGELTNPSGSGSAEPKPSAANQGTIITAEDLFYDVPLRRKSFKSGSDEYNRIIDVVTRYAIHNPDVAWVCKKHGSTQPEVATPSGSSSLSNIGILYGSNVSKELISFGPSSDEDKGIVKVHGYTSGAGHNGKKGILLLFINNRLVESTKFKKAIEAVYTTFLPKGAFPWVYLSLDIEPHRVDVNVHPTKSEVQFLDEDAVVEHVMEEISKALDNANSSRTFNVQTLLPGALEPNVRTISSSGIPRISSKPVAPQHKIRVDPADRKLESMSQFARKNPNELEIPSAKRQKLNETPDLRNITLTKAEAQAGPDVQVVSDDEEDDVNSQYNIIETSTSLRSISKLRRAVTKRGDPGINAVMSKHKYINLVSGTLQALVQCQAQLYILHFGHFSQELFYQLGLRQFGAYGRMVLEPPPSVRALLEIALESESELEAAGLIPTEILERSLSILQERREMLDEYFSLKIDDEGRLRTLPILLPGYAPSIDGLPMLVLSLGVRVDWTDEQECFDTFLRELAVFCTPPALEFDPVNGKKLVDERNDMSTDDIDDTMDTDISEAGKALEEEVTFAKHQIEHLIFPAMRRYVNFPSHLKANIHEIADYKALFKVFERC